VDPRVGLEDMENRKFLTLPGLELLPLGRPACNQSLCRLRYFGPFLITKYFIKLLNCISIHFMGYGVYIYIIFVFI
jgi:hypothetical protein